MLYILSEKKLLTKLFAVSLPLIVDLTWNEPPLHEVFIKDSDYSCFITAEQLCVFLVSKVIVFSKFCGFGPILHVVTIIVAFNKLSTVNIICNIGFD
jgi:hypothetical protein